MAARTRKVRHDELTRHKIRTSQLINRLSAHALGKIAMEPTQVRAIEVLLKKTLPDLAAVQHTGEDGGPVKLEVSWLLGSDE